MHQCHNHKLDFCSSPCVFLGYSSSHLGYRCLDTTFQGIYISRHVCFHEQVFSFDKSKQIAQLTSSFPFLSNPTHFPTFLISPLFHSPTVAASQATIYAHPHQPTSFALLSPHTCLFSNHIANTSPTLSDLHRNRSDVIGSPSS